MPDAKEIKTVIAVLKEINRTVTSGNPFKYRYHYACEAKGKKDKKKTGGVQAVLIYKAEEQKQDEAADNVPGGYAEAGYDVGNPSDKGIKITAIYRQWNIPKQIRRNHRNEANQKDERRYPLFFQFINP
jgi:hypothetical protein